MLIVAASSAAFAGKPVPRPFVVTPEFLGLRLTLGTLERRGIKACKPEAGDKTDKWDTVFRHGMPLGTRLENGYLNEFDQFTSSPAQEAIRDGLADDPASFEITVNGVLRPVQAVWRKSKIVDSGHTGRFSTGLVMQHDFVLRLSGPIHAGDDIEMRAALPELMPLQFVFDDKRLISEAMHVSQIGFEPDDPVKAAYLSFWLGGNPGRQFVDAGVDYQPGTVFRLLDALTLEPVFEGRVELDEPRSKPSNNHENFNGTDVYRLDFSSFARPGRYVAQIDGIGRSIAFEIGDAVWLRPFQAAMAGLYHQRSGIAQGPPWSEWRKPRDLHPADGVKIEKSSATLLDTSMGLNLAKTDSFAALADGKRLGMAQEAWGGWHDAGDWDRRIQHLRTVRDLLELAHYAPVFARKTVLSIPESENSLPDIIDEALWGLDVFVRLQAPHGGVPGGIESAGHPPFGRPSWFENQELFAYAPDPWASLEFAATAARAAFILGAYEPNLAKSYQSRALSAFDWAKAQLNGNLLRIPEIRYSFNLAAIELYRLTREVAYHTYFLESTSYDGGPIAWNEHQFEATLVYHSAAGMMLETKPDILFSARKDLIDRASFLTKKGKRGGFGQVINPNTPYGYGYTSVVPADAASTLVKAHILSGDERFFAAIIGDSQFGLGANPDNLVYTTGLGERSVQTALHADGLAIGQIPDGLTLFGQWNRKKRGNHWGLEAVDEVSYPEMSRAPVHETFHAYIKSPVLSEFSINATLGPVAYVWGYLAATDP